MKRILCKVYRHSSKWDWHINLFPYLNIGNDDYTKLININLGWLFWNLNISISTKNGIKSI